jgi:hypothetical protein
VIVIAAVVVVGDVSSTKFEKGKRTRKSTIIQEITERAAQLSTHTQTLIKNTTRASFDLSAPPEYNDDLSFEALGLRSRLRQLQQVWVCRILPPIDER